MKNKITKNFKLSEYKHLKETNWANPVILKYPDIKVEIVSLDDTPGQSFPILMSDGVHYSVNGKNTVGAKLSIVHDLKPPIVGGRIVSDKTFAIRFQHFLDGVMVNDCGSEEELEYLKMVANDLLQWQISTVTTDEEIRYFKNLGIEI